ncbi:thiaminase II [candidate division KSB1 bacterium]|nr:thiaminase II [candidate division KSB1 bacterium]NIR69601.1 thiaminase II [candidate division KSB1 bacterium]NIS24318.1 thiaminase II [candidate division KSB1 bacterium]NIT71246.1 thiaminase II [candidate division KSB1 bacterium]NIU24950.1 thiaminase II [candidate division KSB1 bacterium]
MESFSETMKKAADSVWQAILAHPFVEGIGDGSLSRERYEFYLKQDYAYLIEFSRVFALASAKAHQLDDMGYFAKLLDLTLNTEMDLHRRTCAGFGITSEELEQTEPAMITLAYTSFLVKTCYEESLPGIIAVLLPCAWGYVYIANDLKSKGLPDTQHYREWIETYSSEEFLEWADWLRNRMDAFASEAPTVDKERWKNLYLQSARFELLFFEMGYKEEMWPELLPQ